MFPHLAFPQQIFFWSSLSFYLSFFISFSLFVSSFPSTAFGVETPRAETFGAELNSVDRAVQKCTVRKSHSVETHSTEISNHAILRCCSHHILTDYDLSSSSDVHKLIGPQTLVLINCKSSFFKLIFLVVYFN